MDFVESMERLESHALFVMFLRFVFLHFGVRVRRIRIVRCPIRDSTT